MGRIKIYADNRFLTLISGEHPPEIGERLQDKASVWEFFSDGKQAAAFIEVTDTGKAMHELFDDFTRIQAGGGIVLNEQGEILLIFRRGHWDLPKGKLDAGETIEACALREVREETGLTTLTGGARLAITYHVYQHHGSPVLKETHWFLMRAAGNQQVVVQTEEDIERAEWVPPTALEKYRTNMFPMIWDLLQKR